MRTLLEPAQRTADALAMKPVAGVPSALVHIMDTAYLESRSGHPPGSFRADPERVYYDFLRKAGVCLVDQYLADNPLSMGAHGYEAEVARGASTGAESVVLDGMTIDSPEAVVAHLERIVFPELDRAMAEPFDEDARIEALIAGERCMQNRLGPAILKVPYGGGFQHFPYLRYTTYGYANYFMAYLAYPEVMERDFALQADLAVKHNRAAARAIVEGGLPAVLRLDHDMADSRGTLVDVRSLDRIWFPHFARAIQPYLDAGIRLLWHCDGNLMAMVPRLIEVGVGGFQGFQYETGMDYVRVCRMTGRDGGPLMIWAGVSVTTTLPFGTPGDVRRELQWIVDSGPSAGLFLGVSSSVTPGVPWENLDALAEGLAHFREIGHAGRLNQNPA